MSNFNEYFRTRGAKLMVEKFFTGIDNYSQKKLTNLTFSVHDDDEDDKKSPSYYVENKESATHVVKLKYQVDYEPEIFESEFYVPREVGGTFIIEGAYRIATNTLGNDYDCRINLSAKSPYINFDNEKNRTYDPIKKVLTVKRVNPDLGLVEKVRTYSLDRLDEVSGLEKEVLRLTPKQMKKFQIKLDLDYEPEYISKRLIEDCIAFGDDRKHDFIIDKEIESVSKGFEKFLFMGSNRKNLYTNRKAITSHWIKYRTLQNPLNILTYLCRRYWKGSADSKTGGNEPQVNPGINAINLQAMRSKIQIPESVAYNSTFADLICIADTPINQNVGKQNSLTVSTTITEDGIKFKAYDKDFKVIDIMYDDYLNSKVVASEYIDYDTKTIKPNENGQIQVKHRMRRKMVDASDYDLIDLHPDNRLSETARRVPFLSYTDSVRAHMASSMLKQSIPLVNAERPLVDTGNYEEFQDNTLNEKLDVEEGVVTKVDEEGVTIETPEGKEIKYQRRSAIQSVHDVSVYLEPKVKVGQKVKAGDVITGAVNLEKDTYKSGINTLVLFHAMFGLVNEDALVVSESYAEKTKSYSIINLSIDIKTNETIKDIVPIGTDLTAKQPIVELHKKINLSSTNKGFNEKLGGLDGELNASEYLVSKTLEVPNNYFVATLSDIYLQENKYLKKSERTPQCEETKSYIESFDMDRKAIYKRFPDYIAADRISELDQDEKEKKKGVSHTLRVRLIVKTPLMVGSKLTNRYGGKGVISKILPDDKMPVMIDERGNKKTVDVVMNPYATINRKIPSVTMETLLTRVAHRIYEIVEEKKKSDPESIIPFLEKYYPGRYSNMTAKKFIKLHNESKMEDVYYFSVGSFSTKFTPKLIEEWADELNVKAQSRILMPSDMIADLDELKSELPEEEYQKIVKDMEGKYVEVDRPLSVGYMTMMELHHIPTYSNKVTSSMYGVDINEWKDSPIMGFGEYRKTGQKIGEMELSALLARGATEFINETRGATSVEDNQNFLNNLLGLGLTITDNKGYNQGGSGRKGRIGEIKAKFKLKRK